MSPPRATRGILNIVRTMVTSLLSVSNKDCKNPVVKLYSLHSMNSEVNQSKKLRVIHFVRHAEGYHNVNKDYRSPAHIDALLTPKGIQQCKDLSKDLEKRLSTMDCHNGMTKDETPQLIGRNNKNIFDVECIISSPMRRALQTAQHSFEHLLILNKNQHECNNDEKESESNLLSHQNTRIPFIACEEWRETVNYLCDQRISSSNLKESFPLVNFEHIQHDHDPLWDKYESIYGSHDAFDKHRESADDSGLRERGILAWKFIGNRDEHCIAVVSHSAFFMNMFTRPELCIVSFADDDVEKLMTERPFENCEIRSMAFELI